MSIDTVTRLEGGKELKERTVDAIRHTFEAAGIEFINDERGEGVVKLKPTP
ncbi:hypothetical protein BIWAKO_05126 [Bosea sp. BIWAKO-01]|nr:hypothetical protein BIWAKO_05126 [Bosea sp. BIWAKO-01]